MAKKHKKTANEFTNVRDIRDIFLYNKTGYVLCYLKVHHYNIDLLSDEEKEAKTNTLARSFESDKKDFGYFSLPRELDLEVYKRHIKNARSECINDFGRKHILNELIMQAVELETNGENFDHQQYIKLWRIIGSDIKEAERSLRQRLMEFKGRYEMVGVKTDILHTEDIIKMCNLFGNSTQAPYDVPIQPTYDPVMFLK